MMSTKLELSKESFFPWLFAEETLSVTRLSPTSGRFAAFLWAETGALVQDRTNWTQVQWQASLANPWKEFYSVYVDQEPAGCCELVREKGLMRTGNVKINLFGLLPEFDEEALRAALLTKMVEKALATGAKRVTLAADQSVPESFIQTCRSQGFRALSVS